MKAWTNVRSWAGVLSSRGRPYPTLSGHRPRDHLNSSDVSVNGYYRRRSCGHLIGESADRTSTQDSSYVSRTSRPLEISSRASCELLIRQGFISTSQSRECVAHAGDHDLRDRRVVRPVGGQGGEACLNELRTSFLLPHKAVDRLSLPETDHHASPGSSLIDIRQARGGSTARKPGSRQPWRGIAATTRVSKFSQRLNQRYWSATATV
jgi:hypothetical protein